MSLWFLESLLHADATRDLLAVTYRHNGRSDRFSFQDPP
jgi:hypothetical protein